MNLQISGLQKNYAGQCVLNIDSLTIEKRSFLGIIGSNGAGKSTLIKIIAGLVDASSGFINYDGEKVSHRIQQNMTLVFQKPYLLRTTVFNNIAYPLIIRNMKRDDILTRVKEVMKSMDIEYLQNQKAWTLSGGEAQKVALARAIVIKPSLLLLDEPTANIDPSSVLVMEETIKKFHQENKSTVIIITHNLQQSKRLCKEVAFMNEGKIIEMGEVDNIFNDCNNPLTKKFIEGEILI